MSRTTLLSGPGMAVAPNVQWARSSSPEPWGPLPFGRRTGVASTTSPIPRAVVQQRVAGSLVAPSSIAGRPSAAGEAPLTPRGRQSQQEPRPWAQSMGRSSQGMLLAAVAGTPNGAGGFAFPTGNGAGCISANSPRRPSQSTTLATSAVTGTPAVGATTGGSYVAARTAPTSAAAPEVSTPATVSHHPGGQREGLATSMEPPLPPLPIRAAPHSWEPPSVAARAGAAAANLSPRGGSFQPPLQQARRECRDNSRIRLRFASFESFEEETARGAAAGGGTRSWPLALPQGEASEQRPVGRLRSCTPPASDNSGRAATAAAAAVGFLLRNGQEGGGRDASRPREEGMPTTKLPSNQSFPPAFARTRTPTSTAQSSSDQQEERDEPARLSFQDMPPPGQEACDELPPGMPKEEGQEGARQAAVAGDGPPKVGRRPEANVQRIGSLSLSVMGVLDCGEEAIGNESSMEGELWRTRIIPRESDSLAVDEEAEEAEEQEEQEELRTLPVPSSSPRQWTPRQEQPQPETAPAPRQPNRLLLPLSPVAMRQRHTGGSFAGTTTAASPTERQPRLVQSSQSLVAPASPPTTVLSSSGQAWRRGVSAGAGGPDHVTLTPRSGDADFNPLPRFEPRSITPPRGSSPERDGGTCFQPPAVLFCGKEDAAEEQKRTGNSWLPPFRLGAKSSASAAEPPLLLPPPPAKEESSNVIASATVTLFGGDEDDALPRAASERDENAYLRRNIEHLRQTKRLMADRIGCLERRVQCLDEQLRCGREQEVYTTAGYAFDGGGAVWDGHDAELRSLHQQLGAVQLVKDALNRENLDLHHKLRIAQEAIEARASTRRLASCVICMDNLVNVVCLPCKHLALCSFCSQRDQVEACPICRCAIADRLQIFMP